MVAVDMSRHAAVLALAVFMKDDWSFFAHTFHGDKDIFRLAFLIMRSQFYFNRHLPGSSIVGGGWNALVHFFGDSSLPLFFNQRGIFTIEAFRNVFRVRQEAVSVCNSEKTSKVYRPLTLTEDGFDSDALAAQISALVRVAEAKWSLVSSERRY